MAGGGGAVAGRPGRASAVYRSSGTVYHSRSRPSAQRRSPPLASVALQLWQTVRAAALDEIEAAHRLVGGSGPGRRYATQQINHAYAVLLSSQFQGFCRDLHTECVDAIAAAFTRPGLSQAVRDEFLLARKLDRGNPNPANIGADF